MSRVIEQPRAAGPIADADFEEAFRVGVHPSQLVEGGVRWNVGEPVVPWQDFLAQYRWYRRIGQVLRPKEFLEIGVGYGYSTFAILSGLEKRCEVWWIDDESGWPGSLSWARYINCYLAQPDWSKSREHPPIKGSFDLIHIDADHSYDETLANIRFAAGRAAPEAHIICHDAEDPEVSRAIDDFCQNTVGQWGVEKPNDGWWAMNFWRVRCGVRVLHPCVPKDCPLMNWSDNG